MLEVVGLSKHYETPAGPVAVLSGVDLRLEAGDSASIVGPSGSGKSTLLHILGALEPPSAGSVRLNGTDPYALDDRHLAAFRNRRVGFVFQDHHLLPQCSVLENVLIPTLVAGGDGDDHNHGHGDGRAQGHSHAHAHAHDDGHGDGRAQGHSHAHAHDDGHGDSHGHGHGESPRARALELLDQVGLSHRLNHRPGELSGGEKQRVSLARALVRHPQLVLCDEPTGNLDHDATDAVANLLFELHRVQQTILIVVTHNLDLARRFSATYRLSDARLQPL